MLVIVGRLVHSKWRWFLPLSNRRKHMEYGGRWQRLAACRLSGVLLNVSESSVVALQRPVCTLDVVLERCSTGCWLHLAD